MAICAGISKDFGEVAKEAVFGLASLVSDPTEVRTQLTHTGVEGEAIQPRIDCATKTDGPLPELYVPNYVADVVAILHAGTMFQLCRGTRIGNNWDHKATVRVWLHTAYMAAQ